MSFLSEVDTTGGTLEGSDSLMDPLVHVPVAGRGEDLKSSQDGTFSDNIPAELITANNYLPAGLTRILPLLQFLMTLFMSLVMTPESERLGAQWTTNGSLITDSLAVLVG